MVNISLKKLRFGHTLYFIDQPKMPMNRRLTRVLADFYKNIV
jgi:hypothetical protein